MATPVKQNLGLLKLEIFSYGLRIDPSCNLEKDARTILRTRGGLGSGLELYLPGKYYINAPIYEKFAEKSPYLLKKTNSEYFIFKNGKMITKVFLPPRPKFYDRKTTTGKKMSRIAVMQGTYLAVYPTSVCQFWTMEPKKNCRFCSVGLNLGDNEDLEKSVLEVLEVVEAARQEEKITFVHFNSGFNYGREADDILPYVKAVKEKTGLLVGVQILPLKDLKKYEQLKKIGADHISICLELYNPKNFAAYCPGKNKFLGQDTFLKAIEYASKTFGKGRVAGEIIVGLEPITDSIKAVEKFAQFGAVSTVCVFRPCIGTDLEKLSPPNPKEVSKVFKRMYEVCIENDIPVDIAPNVKVSLVILPYEGRFFLEKNLKVFLFQIKMAALKKIFYIFFYAKIYFKRLKLRFANAG